MARHVPGQHGGDHQSAAVLAWNVARHYMADETPAPSIVPDAAQPAATAQTSASTTVAVSAAQPAPVESTLPPPYQTPGLPGSNSQAGGEDQAKSAANGSADGPAPSIDASAPPKFIAHGPVYGASAQASTVTLQAKKSVSLVIRRPDGSVYFAQQLKAGEAYRAPASASLSVDVSEPQDVLVYVLGQLHAPLPTAVTQLSKLTPPPAPAASVSAAPTPAD